MKTVAVICEYNPFHTGHKHHIEKIREDFGSDTRIVAIMSGNYVQRGEIAIAPKYERAKWAVESGVNLVLELPFPYSLASAEFFARGGVSIARDLGIVDAISFGSECGDITRLTEIAENMLTEGYKARLLEKCADKSYAAKGHASVSEEVYRELFPNTDFDFTASNNILAIEYIKAAHAVGFMPQFHTVKRVGADYTAERISESSHQSATAIRRAISRGECVLDYLPEEIRAQVSEALTAGLIPADENKLSPAILSYFSLNCQKASKIMDAEGGLYNRIRKMSLDATDITSLCELSKTKKYTTARIRRAMWYSFFGVTSSDVRSAPAYTTHLAADKIGLEALKQIKKVSGYPVITKPSSTDGLSDAALLQRELSVRADLLYQLSLPKPLSASAVYKTSPYIKK